MTTMSAQQREQQPDPSTSGPDEAWIVGLSVGAPGHEDAVRRLHELLIRAARHQVSRMPAATALGVVRREEVVTTSADEATMSVLRRLGSFEGRSRFTTWAYKFGILQAAVEVRRATWSQREVELGTAAEPVSKHLTPEHFVEATALSRAVTDALTRCLTDHQRRVALALLVEGVPIDVLAEQLGTNRNAIYKTLHDARSRLRADLGSQGFLGRDRSDGDDS